MKIFFDHQIFTFQDMGGVSRYFFEMANNLVNLDENELFLFLGIHISQLPLNHLHHDRLTLKGIKAPDSWIFPKLYRFLSDQLCRKELTRNRPDIYHLTYYSDISSGRSIPKVITVHDMLYEKFPDQFGVTRNTSEKTKAISFADAIICVSENTRRELLDLYPSVENKSFVVHHGVTTLTSNNQVCGVPSIEEPYVLYVGRRNKYKNFQTLLQAFRSVHASFSDIKLLCFGGGRMSQRDLDTIKRLGLSNAVVQISGDDEKLRNAYRNAMCFVYPSQNEGFGLPLLEAMKENCPVVTTNSGPMPEVAGNAALYFSYDSPEECAEKISCILDDSAIKSVLISEGNQQILKFSWEETARKTQLIYKNLI